MTTTWRARVQVAKEKKVNAKEASCTGWRITFLTNWPSSHQSTRAVSTMNILSSSRRVLSSPVALREGFGADNYQDLFRGARILTRKLDREAAYLIKDYVDPRDDIPVEYDPPPPWCLSGTDTRYAPDPHIVVELGAGLGVVGFAIADSLQTYRERRRLQAGPERDDGRIVLSNALPLLPDVVVLTDLEDVCDKLLDPNLSHKASLWSARTNTNVQTAIFHREWRRGSTPSNCIIVPPANERERATGVQVAVAVRPLPWGSLQYVEALARPLAPYQNTNATFTVVCSDLVRTFPIENSRF